MRVGYHCLVPIEQYPCNAQGHVGECKDWGMVQRKLFTIERIVIRRGDKYIANFA
jgi:hypothetical protein